MTHPLALVVYNRPGHTKRVIEALRSRFQPEPLYIFCDGPKSYQDKHNVLAVHDLVAACVTWTTPEILFLRGDNVGLRRSMVAAVDHVLNEHETVIVLEDDCLPGPHFFTFMTECLDRYKDDDRILGVTGYTVPIPRSVLNSYSHDCYSFPRIGSWGWATWRDRWELYERDFAAAYDKAKRSGCDLTAGGKDIPGMIERSIAGELDIWSPGWVLANILSNTYYIYPTKSHVTNIGFDGTGAHCGKSNRYDSPIAKTKPTRFPARAPAPDRRIVENFRKYY